MFPVIECAPAEEIIAWDLGKGETAVLSFTLRNEGWTAVLDDQAARRCARSFAIPLRGALGVVILAKQEGLIPSATNVLRALQDAGMRLDSRILRDALARFVGESWEE
jgi:predicted nucleic acid-binding protein